MLMSIAKTVVMARDRIVGPQSGGEEEDRLNYALRPQKFTQYVGQESLIRKLKIAVEAARGRNEPVDHTLLHGPPGLGTVQTWRMAGVGALTIPGGQVPNGLRKPPMATDGRAKHRLVWTGHSVSEPPTAGPGSVALGSMNMAPSSSGPLGVLA